MIIDYDRNPALTTDQKLQSLIESIQRSFDEISVSIAELQKAVQKLEKEGDI